MDRRESLVALVTGLGFIAAFPGTASATSTTIYDIGTVTIKKKKKGSFNYHEYNVYEDNKKVGELSMNYYGRRDERGIWIEPNTETGFWFCELPDNGNRIILQEAPVKRPPKSFSKAEILSKAMLGVMALRKDQVEKQAVAKIKKLIEEGKEFRIVSK
jgi:hypothetical protein